MTIDDDFLNIKVPSKDIPPCDGNEEGGVGLVPSFPTKSSSKIIERKMHTITTFRIYPNGDMFVVKTQSWFDKKETEFKKKDKLDTFKKEKGVEEL